MKNRQLAVHGSGAKELAFYERAKLAFQVAGARINQLVSRKPKTPPPRSMNDMVAAALHAAAQENMYDFTDQEKVMVKQILEQLVKAQKEKLPKEVT